MAKILVVLPFSGAAVGAGLAIVNAQLTKALAAEGHDVKLLTLTLPKNSWPTQDEHGRAQIIQYPDETARMMVQPNSDDEERAKLYDIINALPDKANPAQLGLDDWQPDIIIGHSRFSGPAAVKLRNRYFPKAQVLYFVHSIPIEGVIVAGYGVNKPETSEQKQIMEVQWMTQADVIVPVGPLIRLGVEKMLAEAYPNPTQPFRVHEFIAGVTMPERTGPTEKPDKLDGAPELLMIGRADAPLKGFEDMIIAAQTLRDNKVNIRLRIRGYGKDPVAVKRVQEFVTTTLDGRTQGGSPDPMTLRIEVLPLTDTRDQLFVDIQRADGVLMPSYLEHFGLSPMDGLAFGKPILVNELSGFGMFIGDPQRFGKCGAACVVRDYTGQEQPLTMANLEPPAKDVFDGRPDVWAIAMQDLVTNQRDRAMDAERLAKQLDGYRWSYTVAALLASTQPDYRRRTTKQGPEGEVLVVEK